MLSVTHHRATHHSNGYAGCPVYITVCVGMDWEPPFRMVTDFVRQIFSWSWETFLGGRKTKFDTKTIIPSDVKNAEEFESKC